MEEFKATRAIESNVISFQNKGITVGKFKVNDGMLSFEGNADESAKIFIKLLKENFNKK